MPNSVKVAAIVLGAGLSSRMAGRNKLLELFDGKPVITHVVNAALESGAELVIAVTGYKAECIEEVLRGLTVKVVRNVDYAQGLSTSLRVGLKTLAPKTDGALILLGDMPEIEASDLDALIAAFQSRQSICIPVRDRRRGNPVLWGAAYFAEMMALSGDVGAKQLLTRYAEHVVEVPVSSDGIFVDVDTASDIERLKMKR
jgi:molybdenum cofactor cytidylyltransferase